jgi:hypothetical protein
MAEMLIVNHEQRRADQGKMRLKKENARKGGKKEGGGIGKFV